MRGNKMSPFQKRINTLTILQGATLRAGFPKDAKNHRVYAFLDESKLQALIKRGKAWTTKAKNCIQTMQAGRPMSTVILHSLLEEAKSIKLNLFPEVRCVYKLTAHTKCGGFCCRICLAISTVEPLCAFGKQEQVHQLVRIVCGPIFGTCLVQLNLAAPAACCSRTDVARNVARDSQDFTALFLWCPRKPFCRVEVWQGPSLTPASTPLLLRWILCARQPKIFASGAQTTTIFCVRLGYALVCRHRKAGTRGQQKTRAPIRQEGRTPRGMVTPMSHRWKWKVAPRMAVQRRLN